MRLTARALPYRHTLEMLLRAFVVGISQQRSPVGLSRFLLPTLLFENKAEVAPRPSITGSDLRRAAERGRGIRRALEAQEDDSTLVPQDRILWAERQRLVVF